jgi:replicative DNA helicase
MNDEAFCMKAMEYLDVDHFTSPALGWTFKKMREHWQAYGRRCDEVPLRESLRMVSPDHAQVLATEVEAIIQIQSVADEYIRHELQDFCRRQVFAVAHTESGALWNEGKTDEAYDAMARAQDRIQQIRFDDVDRQWYTNELDQRYRQYQRDGLNAEHELFATGILPLDQACGGGVARGELWVMFAYAKRCKTTWLINMGYNAVAVDGAKVLHFILEGKGKQAAARYDARFSRELYQDIKAGRMSAQVYRYMQQDFAYKRNRLKALGFEPDMIITDYMDLMRSRTRADSETQHQVNSARDLKRFHLQTDTAGWSAWQGQRPKKGAHDKEHILMSSDVADAYAKVRIVDAYGSLNATDDEMRNNKMRIFMESHRDSPVNQLYHVENDLSRMQMVTRYWVENATQAEQAAADAGTASVVQMPLPLPAGGSTQGT